MLSAAGELFHVGGELDAVLHRLDLRGTGPGTRRKDKGYAHNDEYACTHTHETKRRVGRVESRRVLITDVLKDVHQ